MEKAKKKKTVAKKAPTRKVGGQSKTFLPIQSENIKPTRPRGQETDVKVKIPDGKLDWLETPLKFRNQIERYFDYGANTYLSKVGNIEVELPLYTWSGLALYLGFSSRDALTKFGRKKEYKELVEKAKLVVERAYEERLHSSNPTGAIFALKNFGWTDATEKNVNVNVNPFVKLMQEASKRDKIIIEDTTAEEL